MSETTTPQVVEPVVPDPTPAPPAEPAPTSGEPAMPEWLPERLSRQERAVLRDLGFDGMSREEAARAVQEFRTAHGELAERRASEMTELEQRDARIAELEATITAREAADAASAVEKLREQIAAKHNIPAAFASRLNGTTEEEITADAVALLSSIPGAAEAATPPPVVADQTFTPEQLAALPTEKYAELKEKGLI